MSIEIYRVEDFKGIDQSRTENKLNEGYSPDACNMDTKDGNLAVGYGFSKYIADPIPDSGDIKRMHLWHTYGKDVFVVVAGNGIYAHDGAWKKVYTYDSVESDDWDIVEARIGNTDYLIFANGQTQLVKWDGVNNAELFGTGEWIYESTVQSVSYNATMASSVSYAEADKTGTLTIAMPSGWTTSKDVAFVMPVDMGAITLLKAVIAGTTYNLSYVPIWSAGDKCMVRITGTNTAEPIDDDYGVIGVTLTASVSEEQKTRMLAVGICIDGITQMVESVDGNTVTFDKATTREITAGMSAQIRGGVSDIAVNYVELYYSRLFSAGDKANPSRLYWSQPPGDTRSIEDWSMDEATDATGGGFTEVGSTSGDPITGLCALSNQLLIFKERSVYRLLGDRPSNFRIVPVTRGADRMVNTSRTLHGDIPYWMTRGGLYYHNGQTAALTPTARQIGKTLEKADLSKCKAAENRDRLYFTCCIDGEDAIIVFDLRDKTYMIRNGFSVSDIHAFDGRLFMVNNNRYVYVWDESTDYDGTPINAYWNTPKTDLSTKNAVKALQEMRARGEGGVLMIETNVGGYLKTERYQMPEQTETILRMPLRNEGYVFGFRIFNEAGSWFRLQGGVEVEFELEVD